MSINKELALGGFISRTVDAIIEGRDDADHLWREAIKISKMTPYEFEMYYGEESSV